MEKILEKYMEWKKAEIDKLPSPKELSVSDLGILTLVLQGREKDIMEVLEKTIEDINARRRGEPIFLEDLVEKALSCSTIHFIPMPRGAKITCNLKEEWGWRTVNLLTVGDLFVEEAKRLYKLLYFLKLLEKERKKEKVELT